MSKQTQTYLFISILAFLLGALVMYFFFGNRTAEPIDLPDGNIIGEPSPPDTVYVERYAIDTVWVSSIPDTIIVKQPATISATVDIDEDEQGSFVKTARRRPIYVSYKDYKYDKDLKLLSRFDKKYLVRNQVWAFSFSEVDSFETKLDINWQDYYITNVEPKMQARQLRTEYRGKFKGLIAGAVIAGGLFANETYITVPALVAGSAIFIYF